MASGPSHDYGDAPRPNAAVVMRRTTKAVSAVSTGVPSHWPRGGHSVARVESRSRRPPVLVEDHDQAYHAWKKAGLKDRIAVHIDPHIDFGWILDSDPVGLLQAPSLRAFEEQSRERLLWNFSGRSTGELVHIGNYLNPALREGILDRFYWVVPDGFLDTPGQRARLVGMLNDLQKAHPRAMEKASWVGRSLTTAIYGKQVTVCALSDLPELDEDVLLDLDTDFMVIDRVSECYPYADPRWTKPWIWPDELVARLAARRVRSDFVTIAYSVEGGYTPLGYKYLGDDLARLLGHEGDLSTAERDLMVLERQAAESQEDGNVGEAILAFERALA